MMLKNHIFYSIKPFIPRNLQILIRRQMVLRKLKKFHHIWPIDPEAELPPEGGCGWPDRRKFGLILTHDVETAKGQEKCLDLLELEAELGFRSSFNFVPEGYPISSSLRQHLEIRGFEVGVHGLNHDGKLYQSKKKFIARAVRINTYLKKWGAVGFRSPAMHHNLDWIQELNIDYDASTFDIDPFEPQSDGVATVCPFWVEGVSPQSGFIELPYTLPQDFLLFILMKEKSIAIWKKKIDWIAKHGGMVLLNTHPDYMNFNGIKCGPEEYPVEYYREFLNYMNKKYQGKFWHALPKDAAKFFKTLIKGAYPNTL